MGQESYPSNKSHFLKLKKFAKTLLIICNGAKIKPTLYGSYLLFHYTKDKTIKVNDIDFYIKEKEFSKLIKLLDKHKIKFKFSQKYHTLQVFDGNSKIEFDSIDFWYDGSRKFNNINFDGISVKTITLNALKSIYKKASEESKDKPESNRRKYDLILKFEREENNI